jgi:para-nitrobenzyl esterase
VYLAGLAGCGALVCGAFVASAAPTAPIVSTDLGQIRGVALDGRAAAFRGIPYAEPPTGPRRWQPTVPAAPWDQLRDATQFGANCPQPSRGADPGPQSEDCLTLNVITPDLRARKLPVLVSIHGGAFFAGSGRYIAEQGLSPIVRAGVVLVSPNYRIGRLGFFAHPGITATTANEPVANYWLTDQIEALRWVKRNIASFGGDPDNVTILGCSAGGSSINSLMASPVSRGLFARASVHSGGGFFNATRTLAVAEQQGLEFAARAGVSGTGPEALTRLRKLSVEQVLAADPGPPNFGAVIDGRLLTDQISVSFARGNVAKVPMVVGSTSNEASVFGLMGFDRTVLRERFAVDVEGLRPVYEQSGKLSDAELLRQIQTDFIFTSASLGMATLAASSGLPTYAYHFDYVPEPERAAVPGAPHCADMPYRFGAAKDPSPAGRSVAKTMQGYLVNFARTGNPNGPGLPAWPAFDPARPAPLFVGDSVKPAPLFRARQLAPWYAKWSTDTKQAFPGLR